MYRSGSTAKKPEKRFPLFIFHDRDIGWEYIQRNDLSWWDNSLTFREWMEVFPAIDP